MVCIINKRTLDKEKFPDIFLVKISEISVHGQLMIRTYVDGKQVGDELTDNSYEPDGYRFHDVFHFAYIAILGWSPVMRKLMHRKRKSNLKLDEVEDGGRAQVIDEGICQLVFSYAKNHNWLENTNSIDKEFLEIVRNMAFTLEVGKYSLAEWEKAILLGFEVWRKVFKDKGGIFLVNTLNKKIVFLDD